MIKKNIILLLIAIMVLSSFTVVYAEVGGTTTRNINKTTTTSFNNKLQVNYASETINYDVEPNIIDGKLMIPLRFTLEKQGYNVEWNNNERSVSINKGAQYTKIFIDENKYFKNKMSHMKLSSAPILLNGRTLVPIEFYHEVLNLSFKSNEGTIKFHNEEEQESLVTHTGIVKEISEKKDGFSSYHISTKDNDTIDLIIHSSRNTYSQKNIKINDSINAISLPMMTMSYPGQTGALVIY